MTETVIRPRVQPEESPGQWRRRMFVLRSASVFTRLEQNFRSGGAEQRFVRGKARHGRIAFQRKRRFPQAMRSISGRNGTLPPPIKAAGTERRKEKRTVQPKLNRPFKQR